MYKVIIILLSLSAYGQDHSSCHYASVPNFKGAYEAVYSGYFSKKEYSDYFIEKGIKIIKLGKGSYYREIPIPVLLPQVEVFSVRKTTDKLGISKICYNFRVKKYSQKMHEEYQEYFERRYMFFISHFGRESKSAVIDEHYLSPVIIQKRIGMVYLQGLCRIYLSKYQKWDCDNVSYYDL